MTAAGQRDILFVADDFTGGSDTLATLARASLAARLYLAMPDPADPELADLDAFGVATAARSMSSLAIRREMEHLGVVIAAHKPRFLHYKICSTFDSSPDLGSIGAAVSVLRAHIDSPFVAIVGGQPTLGRYMAFGKLFAAGQAGHVHRIDRHPLMSRHHVTPMDEADMRIHLARQGLDDIELIGRDRYQGAPDSVIGDLHSAKSGATFLFDVLEQDDLRALAIILRQAAPLDRTVLCVGPSSVADALSGGAAPPEPARTNDGWDTRKGPVFAFAGSRSVATEAQVAATRTFHKIALDPELLLPNMGAIVRLCRTALFEGHNVLAHLDAQTGHDLSPSRVAEASARIVAATCRDGLAGMLVVAGGDTSSFAIRQLAPKSLSYVRDVDPGVSLCRCHSDDSALDGLQVIMKGGQLGRIDLFDSLARMASAARTA